MNIYRLAKSPAFFLLLIGLVSLPAVTGPFLFDDFSNLDGLVSINEGTKSSMGFVLDGKSGPTGRPVALVTFLWSSDSFPTNPFPFKLINLTIHLFNAILLFGIAKMIVISAGLTRAQATTAGIVAMFIWGVHPINQSAVYLVVQRMTLLMTFFAFAAIFVFIRYRNTLKTPLDLRAVVVVMSIGLLGLLSVFSKEAGVILPLLLLVIQATIFSSKITDCGVNHNRLSPVVNWGVIYLPSILVILAFLYWVIFRTNPDFTNRDFNMYERVLTQFRVVIDYLGQIMLPRLSGSGLFHDDYVVSLSLFSPKSTLFSLVVLFFGIVLFFIKRHKWRVASFAVLFYAVGHLIESTFLNLELYFEHRNYLPTAGLAVAAGYGFVKATANIRMLLLMLIALIALIGTYNAYTWGGLSRIASSWSSENPNSVRSQVLLARYWGAVGDYDAATQSIQRAMNIDPFDGTIHLQLAVHKCIRSGMLGKGEFAELVNGIHNAKDYNLGMSDAAQLMVEMLKLDACSGFTAVELIDLYTHILGSKALVGRTNKYNLAFQVSQLYVITGDFVGYMNALEKSYTIFPNLQIINLQIRTLISAGLYDELPFFIDKGYILIENGKASSVDTGEFNALVIEYGNTQDKGIDNTHNAN